MASKRIDDNELLVAILTSGSYTEAARVLGVTKQTVTRRMRDSELKNRIIELRKNVLDSVNARLIEASNQAVDVLINLMKSENEQTDYSGPTAHPGRSSAQPDRASAHLILTAVQLMLTADQHTC